VVRGRRETSSEAEFATMGDRLRRARTSRGLSLRAVAKRLGVSPSLISQVETGRAMPSVSTLYALATELGISLDELLFVDAHRPRRPRRPRPRRPSRSTIRSPATRSSAPRHA
jgi:transcriptional regulator with XRE-family HTH domain